MTERWPDPELLSIVIPAYNESHRLPVTLAEIRKYLEITFPRYEIVIVDDGSSDGTGDVVEGLIKNGWPSLRLLRQPRNLGKGAAVRRGCLESAGDLVLFMDADHAVPIAEIEIFVEAMHRQQADVVVGVRTYQSNESKWRRILGLGLQMIAHLIVFKKAVIDSQCGFKLFRREAIRRIFPLCRVNGGMIDVEIFYLMHLKDISCYFEAVHWNNKEGSRINIVRCIVFDPIDMLRIRLCDATGLYGKPLSDDMQPWRRGLSRA